MAKKTLALLSNVTVDLIKQRLTKKFDVYIPEGYDTWIQEVLNPDAPFYNEKFDAVVVLLDGTVAEEWETKSVANENVNMWKQGISALANRFTEIPIFISTVDFRENRIKALSESKYRISLQNNWYEFVQGISESTENVYVFDLADRIADIGRNQFYSNKMWYMSSMPYSREGMLAVCEEITRLMNSAFEPRKKLIALDLDNTLWGGVIGEDGIDGIELSDHKEGQRYYDFQRQLKEIQERGTLLAIVSKNNPEDAENVINTHPYMLLRDDNFVSNKTNWKTKAENLKELESELNLTEGSFVFVDDNPAEQETVRGNCPDMLVPEFPTDTTTLKEFAEDLFFDEIRPLRILDEDKNKTKLYQAETKRTQDYDQNISLDKYLEKLEMSADIHQMRPEETNRVVQLCGKTNQFNLTTKRYTREEIIAIDTDESNAIYVAYLNDKYGESGLVGVVILCGTGKEKIIDTFLMSCRVMGRKLEDAILNGLVRYYKDRCDSFTAEYILTSKNAPVSELYDRLGFHKISEQNGNKKYELQLNSYKEKDVSFYKEISFQDNC